MFGIVSGRKVDPLQAHGQRLWDRVARLIKTKAIGFEIFAFSLIFKLIAFAISRLKLHLISHKIIFGCNQVEVIPSHLVVLM